MSGQTPHILFVEDAPDMRMLGRAFLEEAGYKVTEAETGEIAWDLLEKNSEHIDAILLDIILPGISGYDFCTKAKEDPRFDQIPIIFASSLTDLDEKIKGYSCGADDYVTKPIAFEELTEKLKRVLDTKSKVKKIQNQVSVSNSAALEAMNYSSDLGQIISFYKSSLNAQNYEELAGHVFEVSNFLGLKASIMFTVNKNLNAFSSSGTPSPLELNILEMTRGGKRFFDFGPRTIVTHDTFSLLIKNMPVDRPERYGVLKDTLGALGDAIEARVAALIQNGIESKRNNLIKAIKSATSEAENTFEKIYNDVNSALQNMYANIDDAFISLGLSEQQEDRIRDSLTNGINGVESSLNHGDQLLAQFDRIGNALQQTLSIKKDT